MQFILASILYSASFGGVSCTEMPEKFIARIGGFLGASYSVEWNGQGWLYSYNPTTFVGSPGTQSEALRPSKEDWMRFCTKLKLLGVENWAETYAKPNVMDGTQWQLSVLGTQASFESKGANAYPPEVQFQGFLAAVRDFTGGKEFK